MTKRLIKTRRDHRQVRRLIEQEAAIVLTFNPPAGALAGATAGAPAVAASGTITITSTGPADGQQFAAGGVTYTLVTALSTEPTVPNEIVRSDTPATVASRVAAAINDGAGEHVSVGTVANPDVSAVAEEGVVTVTARAAGPDGNEIVFDNEGTFANATFSPNEGVLGNGADPVYTPYEDDIAISNAGIAGVGYVISDGALPPGLSLSVEGNEAIISGVPPIGSAGAYNFTIRATTEFGATGTAAYSITVSAP